MKTKEYNEAVEKLGKAFLDRIYQGDLPVTYSDARKVFSELAKTAIEALNVEIVSRESQQGALVTRKNNKPAVYVENIGGKDGK